MICLQEVQQNHFDDFFSNKLSEKGFEGMYRPKSSGNKSQNRKVDGCAIFFRRDRFEVHQRYHIEFNDTSSLYLDILQNKATSAGKAYPEDQVKEMTKRLTKGNIALIVVLDVKSPKSTDDDTEKGEDDTSKSRKKKMGNLETKNIADQDRNTTSSTSNGYGIMLFAHGILDHIHS